MSRLAAKGFGAPFWTRRVQDALFAGAGSISGIGPVIEELIEQTRLDESLSCRRAMSDEEVDARIKLHRKNLRAARRGR